ncbi:pre-mRNA-splicing factor 38-like [Silene latifolia]|uniref:pre-mRNA-splicing factor 38-like n=1 Tax=Silene latifolia TaxID=37657 RepID=UPI003D782140
MANRTDPLAKNIRGTDPQNLIDKIIRSKVHEHTYWKEHCFGLTAETLVDKAIELNHIGGTYGGNRKPTPFLCLVLKMLQIQPEKDIVVEFIKNEDYKYVRILGAFYLRLTGTDTDVYLYLEPLYNDYRKLRMMNQDGRFCLIHVDEFIDDLINKDYLCDIAMPRIKKRWNLENIGILVPRISALEDEIDEEEEDEMDVDDERENDYRGRSPIRDRDRDYRGRDRDRDRDYRGRDRDRDRDYRGRDRDRDYRDRDCDSDYDSDRGRGRDRDRDYRDRDRDRYRKRNYARRRSPRRHGDDYDDGTDHPDPEIAEANKLRAKLGLKPLRL